MTCNYCRRHQTAVQPLTLAAVLCSPYWCDVTSSGVFFTSFFLKKVSLTNSRCRSKQPDNDSLKHSLALCYTVRISLPELEANRCHLFCPIQTFLPNLSAFRFESPALRQIQWMVHVVRNPHISTCLGQCFLRSENDMFEGVWASGFCGYKIIHFSGVSNHFTGLFSQWLCDFGIGQFMVVSTYGFCGLDNTSLPHVPYNGFCVSKTTCKLSVLDGFCLLSKYTVSSTGNGS